MMASHTQKTAAVYDRWLFTLGGGEQVAFAYAEVLRDLGYDTTLLTHKKIDVTKAEKKMNVDLSDITVRYLPQLPTEAIAQFTEEYDVFINTSYLDYFPNRSALGILSVFFPDQIFISPLEYCKRGIVVPFLRRFFVYPTHFEGFLFDEYKNKLLYRWVGPQSSIQFSQKIQKLTMEFYFPTVCFGVIDQVVFRVRGVPIQPTGRVFKHKDNRVIWTFDVTLNPQDVFEILLPEHPYAKDVAMVKLTIPSLRYLLYNQFKSLFPRWEMRLHGGPGVTRQSDLASYQKIVTISEFCKNWITRYWKLDSEIVYPPVNTQQFAPARTKKNWIVHVGRFFVTGHSKKQLDLIKAFKKIYQKMDGAGEWELHCIGSVEHGTAHQNYYDQCVAEADGFPIVFHQDIPFTTLREILGTAKIYWHATGLDENERTNPILFEHFGITTVEAMASGCVPVVINAGGQKEIVTKECGVVWNTREELIEKTMGLMHDKSQLQKLSSAAVRRAKFFDRSAFRQRCAAILGVGTKK